MRQIKRALVSVSDKTGLIEFLNPLIIKYHLEIVSTGGTLAYLRKNKIDAIDVAEVTRFPEVLDGRVKTLHPHIHMGLLADQKSQDHLNQLKQFEVKAFDLVVGNLYPFEETALNPDSKLDDLIENIDIGGPSFLRASAKNYQSVIVVSDPQDYKWVQEKILIQTLSDEDRKNLALKVFSLTSYYDALIVQRMSPDTAQLNYLNIPLKKKSQLRYGENSHQKASWYYQPLLKNSLSEITFHQGKELSYNNLLDLDSALELVRQFVKPACVAVKHNNPCGVATGADLLQASLKAINADPKSIFGGIVAFNSEVTIEVCHAFKDLFLECMIAPSFTSESLSFLSAKKNLRVLSLPEFKQDLIQIKSISGGVLLQDKDFFTNSQNWNMYGAQPDIKIKESILFGEKVVTYLKSNAIAIVYNEQTIGLGMGQVNRVDAVEQAIQRMHDFLSRQNENINMDDVVLVSDAFFPFSDSIDVIAKNKIRWIIQPGGSVKDSQVIQAIEQQKVNMVLTHTRHFRH